MTDAGNKVFLFVLTFGAVISTIGIAFLGLNTLSLAIVVLSLFVSIPVGLYLERKVNDREEQKNKDAVEKLFSDLED